MSLSLQVPSWYLDSVFFFTNNIWTPFTEDLIVESHSLLSHKKKLGEWMKMTSVRSPDHRRIPLSTTSHTFPSNTWIHKITKGKESDRCDLCKVLWLEEDRFTTEKDLPEQTLGHIHHTCEVLSSAHMDTHHQCWCLIHGELTRLSSPEWKFLCNSGEKCL